jgi:hypothetical protein
VPYLSCRAIIVLFMSPAYVSLHRLNSFTLLASHHPKNAWSSIVAKDWRRMVRE